MTTVTVKSAELAKAIVAMIMPKASAEKREVGIGSQNKIQNRFFNDASGNSYCEAYAADCETLEKINIFDDRDDVVATIEIDSDNGQDEISAEQIKEICELADDVLRTHLKNDKVEKIQAIIENLKSKIEYEKKELAEFDELVKRNGILPMYSTPHRKIHEEILAGFVEELAEAEKELENLLNSATVEEIDPADYAVSVEAQDVAIDSEIENASNAELKEIAAEIVAEIKAATLKVDEEEMKNSSKEYFIEVYTNEFGNSDNDAENVAQYEFPDLLTAYDAVAKIKEEFEGEDFYKLEIVDSEDLNRVYYKLNMFGGKIFEPELRELIDNRENAAEVEELIKQVAEVEENSPSIEKIFAAVEEVETEKQNLTMTITDEPLSAVLDVNLNGQKIIRLYYDLKSKPIIEIYGEISHSVSTWKVPYTGLKYGDRGGHYEREYVTEKTWKTYKNKKSADVMLAQYGFTFEDVEKMFEIGINYLDAIDDIENEMEVDDPVEDAIFAAVDENNTPAEKYPAIKVKSAEDATKLIQMTMSNGIMCENIDNVKILKHQDKVVRLEIDDKINIADWEYVLYAEEIHRKLDLPPVIKPELDDWQDDYGEKSLNSILVKINGLDVIYYGYGFGADFHEYDEKLLHINVDRDRHSLADNKGDEFKTYKSKKKMNMALAKYGLTFEQIEQFFANEEAKLIIEDYFVDTDTATEVEIENAEMTENNLPSVEEIFVKVIATSGIAPADNGKYYLYINDNNRLQKAGKKFKTLTDAIKIARIMHAEVSKVSKHIYANIERENKSDVWGDGWITLYRIDNYGKEKVKHRDTVDAIAEIENRTIEEVGKDICTYGDDYGVYKNSAKKVEKVSMETVKKKLPYKMFMSAARVMKKFLKVGDVKRASIIFETQKNFFRVA